MLRSAIISAWSSTSLMATGVLIALSAVEVLAVTQIGPETEVTGVSLAAIGGMIAAGLGFLWIGGKSIFRFGANVEQFSRAVKRAEKLADRLEKLEARMEQTERWQREHDDLMAELRRRYGEGRMQA